MGNDDPYRILGVSRTATTKDIKSAYRRKARDTHPDKNPGADPDEAAAEFRKVVDAFELLSDEGSRRGYDRTEHSDGSGGFGFSGSGSASGGGGGGEGGSWTWTWTFRDGRFHASRKQRPRETWAERQKRIMKNRRDVREAQGRVMHVVSLEQLKTVMLDDDDVVERSLLMCFVTPGTVEKVAEDDILFPYPFAGMSTQRIWWEDLLQTVSIKYHRPSELSRFFKLPPGDELTTSGKPVFIFVRRGYPLSRYSKLSTSDRENFESWVWKQLEVPVTFINNHTHPVELYWIHGSQTKLQGKIQPGEKHAEQTMLSHEFYARDERVDTRPDSPNRYKLSANSSLGSWKILSDEVDVIYINTRCVDLSGHCEFWAHHPPGECERNPGFMRSNCAKTCMACGDVHSGTMLHAEDGSSGGRDEF